MSDRLSIYNGSAYTITGLSMEIGCTEDILRGWIYHNRTPRKKNKVLFEDAMSKLSKSPPPIKFHLEMQTKNKGKYK